MEESKALDVRGKVVEGEVMREAPPGMQKYELEAWLVPLGSFPVERIAYKDYEPSYEVYRAHVWLLENGRFALVTESGCSCYKPESANIDIFPASGAGRAAALEKFTDWGKKDHS